MSNSTANITIDFDAQHLGNTIFMCSLYLSLGTVAIMANLLNLVTYLTSKELRNNFVFLIALDFGEILNGVSYVLTGIGRGSHALGGTFNTPISVRNCFFTRYWPALLIVGTELPAFITLLTSMERVVAVQRPAQYNKLFNPKMKLFFLIFLVALQLSSLIWAAVGALHSTKVNGDQHCAIIGSTSDEYSTFHFIFIVLAYVVSFCSLFVVHQFQMQREEDARLTQKIIHPTKRAPRLKIFLAMTSIDIVLVSMPAFVMLGAKWQWFHPNDIVVSLTYSTTGFLSIVHISINFFFQSEFRRQIRYLWLKLRGQKQQSDTAVTFVNHSTYNSPSKVTMIVHESPIGSKSMKFGSSHNTTKCR
ncbi:hypothetical protein M3Y94_01096600 [Aphelenchoides besseyi]|nr:hypothetical protein M3Y94_01096600 [Aphelenchoides besseyi]KAI6221657.1 hypothetical protein M3Y95_00985300 [Aphelenchoides besseyi]